jgi:hypothetical protein
VTNFTEAQLDALGTALVLARQGVGFTVSDETKREICRSLVESGHMVEIPGVEDGFTVSNEFAAAMLIDEARVAEAADRKLKLRCRDLPLASRTKPRSRSPGRLG